MKDIVVVSSGERRRFMATYFNKTKDSKARPYLPHPYTHLYCCHCRWLTMCAAEYIPRRNMHPVPRANISSSEESITCPNESRNCILSTVDHNTYTLTHLCVYRVRIHSDEYTTD